MSAFKNPYYKGKIEKLRQSVPEEMRQEFDAEEAYICALFDQTNSEAELIDVLINALVEARQGQQIAREFMQILGEVLLPPTIIGFHTDIGIAKDEVNGITLRMSSTEGTRIPFITCIETQKQYMMNWEGICRLAIRAGVADKQSEV